jgi:hypothetical protein
MKKNATYIRIINSIGVTVTSVVKALVIELVKSNPVPVQAKKEDKKAYAARVKLHSTAVRTTIMDDTEKAGLNREAVKKALNRLGYRVRVHASNGSTTPAWSYTSLSKKDKIRALNAMSVPAKTITAIVG